MPAPCRPSAGPLPSLLTVVALLGSGLLAGCSGDDAAEEPGGPSTAASDGGTSDTTDAASPFVSPSTSEESADAEAAAAGQEVDVPLPKAPRPRNTPDGRKAWTEFVVERWGYALATNEASALADLSAKGSTCQGCRELDKELDKRRKQGWSVDFPGASVEKTTVKGAGAPATFEATAVIDIPASRSYFEDGTYRNENEAFENSDFVVRMKYTKTRYVLLSFRVT